MATGMAIGEAVKGGIGNAIGSATGGIIGALTGKKNHERNKELMDKQLANQQRLNDEANRTNNENWEKQNKYNSPEEVRKRLQEAGLNVGLMYGGSGAGGSTMAMPTGSGGSASGGSVSSSEVVQGMQAGGNMGMGIQMMEANKNLINSQARLNNVTADKKAGSETKLDESNTYLNNLRSQNQIIENKIQEESMESIIESYKQNATKAAAEASSATTEADLNASAKKDRLTKIYNEALNSALDGMATKAGIKLTRAQANKVQADIEQGWENVYTNTTNAKTNKDNAETNRVNAEQQLKKIVQDAMYQNGLLEQGDRKLTQDMILGLANIGTSLIPTTKATSSVREMYDGNGKSKGTLETNTKTTDKKGK